MAENSLYFEVIIMGRTEIIVIIGGAILIALTLWYFFDESEKIAAE